MVDMKLAESEITECLELEAKSKIGNIFVNEKIRENIVLKFSKLIPVFLRIMKKNKRKEKLMQMEKLMKKVMLANILLLKIIYEKHQKKNLTANLLGCYQGYDADYETCRIQIFISEFKK